MYIKHIISNTLYYSIVLFLLFGLIWAIIFDTKTYFFKTNSPYIFLGFIFNTEKHYSSYFPIESELIPNHVFLIARSQTIGYNVTSTKH